MTTYHFETDDRRQTLTEREMGIVLAIIRQEHDGLYEQYTGKMGDNVPPHDFEIESISKKEIDEVGDKMRALSGKEYSDFL